MSLTPFVHVATEDDAFGPDRSVPLDAATRAHLVRVLRLSDGAALEVSDGRGHVAAARLDGTSVRVVGPVRTQPPDRPELVLAQAIPKARGLDEVVRAAVELGVDRVVPLVTERTVGRGAGDAGAGAVERARAVAAAAAAQARRAWLPVVEPARTLAAFVADLEPGRDLVVVGTAGGPGPRERAAALATMRERVVVVVGPEGGLSPAETEALDAAGALTLGLGASVLRTVHAGLPLLAVVAAAAGRFERTPA